MDIKLHKQWDGVLPTLSGAMRHTERVRPPAEETLP